MREETGFQFQGTAEIGKQEFRAAILKRGDKLMARLVWYNKNGVSFAAFLADLEESLDGVFNFALPFDFVIQNAGITLQPGSRNLQVQALITQTGKEKGVRVCFGKIDNTLALGFRLDTPILFRNIPLLGKAAAENDAIESVSFSISKTGDSIRYHFEAPYCISGKEEKLSSGGRDAFGMDEAALFEKGPGGETQSEELVEAPVQADSVRWKDLGKAIGPLTLKRVGFEAKKSGEEYEIRLYLDASFSLSVLEVSLSGLSVGLPLSALTSGNWSALKKVKFGMRGLGILFQNGPLTIGGCLLRKEGDHDRYDGAVVVRYQDFSLTALGSYTTTEDGSTSLFIFLSAGYPLGGPPAFFITGLAAGFGINRGLKIPEVKSVPQFPLLALMREKKKKLDLDEAVSRMGDTIYVSRGQNFIAAGIEFTTFGLLKSAALVTVEFGKEFELHLLGISELQIPPVSSKPFLYAQLALIAQISPEKGFYSMEAVLTEESYLFHKSCRLTGGFAFYLWTKGDHKGDFVVTLGGYHPKFVKPAHYPAVPRVGVNWKISDCLSLKGEGYFAVTPRAIMAGGCLNFLFDKGNLQAWFYAGADFLIQWAPFSYDIEIGVRIGAAYTLKILFIRTRLKIELGARLHLYGPEFAGDVNISWFIISFHIRFGNRNPAPPPLSYMEFRNKFLQDALQIGTGGGLAGEAREGDFKIPIVSPENAMFSFTSKVPLTQVSVLGEELYRLPDGSNRIGVYPMGTRKKLCSQNTVSLYRLEKHNNQEIWRPVAGLGRLKADLRHENLPSALWGRENTSPYQVSFVNTVLTGFQLWISQPENPVNKPAATPEYDLDVLTANVVVSAGTFPAREPASYEIKDDINVTLETVVEREKRKWPQYRFLEQIGRKRRCFFEYMGRAGIETRAPEELEESGLYTEPENHFICRPVVRTIEGGRSHE